MATLLSITNKVLKRLREDEAADLTSDAYVSLIADFVADIHQEVNDAGPGWSVLDHEVTQAISASTRTYDLSTDTTPRSTMLWDVEGGPQCWIFDDASEAQGSRMTYLDPTTLERLYQQDRDSTVDNPRYFTLRANSDASGYTLELYPTPSAARYIRIRFNTPEDFLDPDTDAATTILLNERVILLGALYLAQNERGEEIGEPGNVAETRYRMALADAVEDEIRMRERAGYYDWSRN
jgi:hypothetical protein